jgi:predicted Zn-ribbon and HTH transcriptional regulator
MRTMGEIVLRGFICERCGHRWVSRENDKPKVCPGCKSAYWNNPIKQKFSTKEKKRLR